MFSLLSLSTFLILKIRQQQLCLRTHPNFIVNVRLNPNKTNGETSSDSANRVLVWLKKDCDRYAGLLDDDDDLNRALLDGKIFICDYSKLYETNEVKRSTVGDDRDCWLMSPVSLLYASKKNGHLSPLAIEIAPGRFCSPSTSSAGAWLFGRAAVRSADTIAHSLSGHFLGTHLISEVLGVALHRSLPQTHVLFRLLRPHFYETFIVNHTFREFFITTNTGLLTQTHGISPDEIKSYLCRDWPNRSVMDTLILHRDLNRRGVSDQTALPEYPYVNLFCVFDHTHSISRPYHFDLSI